MSNPWALIERGAMALSQAQCKSKKYKDNITWVGINPKNPYAELASYQTPHEKMLFILDDGSALVVGGGTKTSVALPIGEIRKRLAYCGKNWNNITAVIHNHAHDEDFSSSDYNADMVLRKFGFTGQFQAYYPKTGSVRTLKPKRVK